MAHHSAPAIAGDLAFVELEALDAPSEDSYWQGMIAGVGVIGIVAIVAT